MIRWTKTWGVVAFIAVVSSIDAAAAPTAEEVVAASAAAFEAVRSLSYQVRFEGCGDYEPTVEARIVAERLPKGDPLEWKFAIDATFQPASSDQPHRRLATFDGAVFRRRDDAERRVRELPVASRERRNNLGDVTGSLGRQLYYSLEWPVYGTLLSASPALRLEPGEKAVDGVRCVVLTRNVEGSRPQGTTRTTDRLFVGARDHLPRRLEQIVVDETGQITASVHTISALKIDDPIPQEVFTQPIPEGYVVEQVKPPRPAPEPLAIGAAAPPWTLKDAQGRPHSLDDLRGGVVVVDFWAEWCVACKLAMPALQALHQRYGSKGVVVVGIEAPGGVIGAPQSAAEYVAAKGYTYLTLYDGDSAGAAYKAETLPTLYVIDRTGSIVFRKVGVGSEADALALEREIAGVIEPLLK